MSSTAKVSVPCPDCGAAIGVAIEPGAAREDFGADLIAPNATQCASCGAEWDHATENSLLDAAIDRWIAEYNQQWTQD